MGVKLYPKISEWEVRHLFDSKKIPDDHHLVFSTQSELGAGVWYSKVYINKTTGEYWKIEATTRDSEDWATYKPGARQVWPRASVTFQDDKPVEAWTDYPFICLGDESGQEAPVRKITVISYDGNKYCDIRVQGFPESIKLGYIYNDRKLEDPFTNAQACALKGNKR